MASLKQKSAVRQQQIVDAARTLIISKGMGDVTIGAIAQMVHLSEGAIYRHFTSKYQILELVIQDMEASLLGVVDEAQTPGDSAPDNLRRLMDALLANAEEQRAAALLVISQSVAFEGLGLGRRVAEMFTRFLQRIQAILADGVAEGSVRSDMELDAAATAYLGLIQSTATLWALNQFEPTLAEHRAQMWEVFYRGIMPGNLAVAPDTPPVPVAGNPRPERVS